MRDVCLRQIGPLAFWIRRMAHETAVHRVDAAQAVGERWRVDPELAADGVAEALELWLGWAPRLAAPGAPFGSWPAPKQVV